MLLDVFGLDSFWDQVLTCWLCMLSLFRWSILNSFKVWAQNSDNPRTVMQNASQFTSSSHCFICAWDPKACKQSFSNLFAWSDSQRNLQSPSCGNMLITKVSVDVWWYDIVAATNINSNDQIIIQIYTQKTWTNINDSVCGPPRKLSHPHQPYHPAIGATLTDQLTHQHDIYIWYKLIQTCRMIHSWGLGEERTSSWILCFIKYHLFDSQMKLNIKNQEPKGTGPPSEIKPTSEKLI